MNRNVDPGISSFFFLRLQIYEQNQLVKNDVMSGHDILKVFYLIQ